MKTVAIALFMERREDNGVYVPVLTGARLIDVKTLEVAELTIDTIKKAIQDKKLYVHNLRVINGVLKGRNGSIDRLPKIFTNIELINDIDALTVIDRIGGTNGTYVVSNYLGEVSYLYKQNLLGLKVSNGKTVGDDIRDDYFSSIKGGY